MHSGTKYMGVWERIHGQKSKISGQNDVLPTELLKGRCIFKLLPVVCRILKLGLQ